jgi:hypothetical protein
MLFGLLVPAQDAKTKQDRVLRNGRTGTLSLIWDSFRSSNQDK